MTLFSFNDNQQKKKTSSFRERWEPLSIDELSRAPAYVMRALYNTDNPLDSLFFSSLGSLALSGIEQIADESGGTPVIPRVMVLDRVMTTTAKVANKLYSFPVNYILYGIARLLQWDTNPEKALLSIAEKHNQTLKQVVIIQAKADYYFSGVAAFANNIHTNINKFGIQVFQGQFWPVNCLHPRAHHAVSLSLVEQNSETAVISNTRSFFQIQEEENLASAIARNILQKTDRDSQTHRCFLVGGSIATLDIMTVEAEKLLAETRHHRSSNSGRSEAVAGAGAW
jgi:hypothetical protein